MLIITETVNLLNLHKACVFYFLYATSYIKRQRSSVAVNGNLSQSYGASPAIHDHMVLNATRHRWTRSALTPARQAGSLLDLPTPEGWKAELMVMVLYSEDPNYLAEKSLLRADRIVRTTILHVTSAKWLVNFRLHSWLLWPSVTSGLCIGSNWYG